MSDQLRVVMVPAYYPSPENPVAGPFMRDLARAVAARHRVTVLAPPSAAAPKDVDDGGVRTVRLPMLRRGGRLARLERLLHINAAVGQLRREGDQPDLIHAHTFFDGFLPVLVGRRRAVPVVITENYSGLLADELSTREKYLARFTYRHADMVCPVSELLARRLSDLEPQGRYQVVPEVVDVDAFSGSRRAPRMAGTHVVAVAMLVRRKGLHDLIEAVRLLASSGRTISVSIVGEGPERAALAAQANGLPVALLGALPREEVVAHVREADVFAMPTLGDPFGISAVEALAAGVPVVVTSASGTSDLIGAHGGLVVPAGDPSSLADAIAELLGRPGSVPISTREALRRECGPGAVAERFDVVYRRVLREKGR
jgi:glycosyltransferase involved in cell wall biosynthesis